jgi:hypothetical protein
MTNFSSETSCTFNELRKLLSEGSFTPSLAEEINGFVAKFNKDEQWHLHCHWLQVDLYRLIGDNERGLELVSRIQAEDSWQQAKKDFPAIASRLLFSAGLLFRENAKFERAADSFLSSLELDGSQLESLHALQFTRLDDKALQKFLPRLEDFAASSAWVNPLAKQLLSDWQFRLGKQDAALINSFQAAIASVGSSQRSSIDHMAAPSLPELLIIGAPKSGTTSMAAWLSAHPQLYVHPRKELHFFDGRWEWGQTWYRCQFPCFRQSPSADGLDAPILKLEATPNYLQLPNIPGRVHKLMPEAKLLVILRHPLDRALSWYHHIVRQEGVSDTLECVFERELNELEGSSLEEREAIGWHHTNCLLGSAYTEQINRWQRLFPAQQLLVIQMEEWLRSPDQTVHRISDFLALNPTLCNTLTMQAVPRLNAAPKGYDGVASELQNRVLSLLEPEIEYWHALSLG